MKLKIFQAAFCLGFNPQTSKPNLKISMTIKKILLALMLVLINSAFAKEFKFSDYAVPIYTGQIVTEIQRSNKYAKGYKTALKRGLKENGVNFSGHYSLVTIGCGSDCLTIGIVDVKTGKVYHDKWLGVFSSYIRNDDREGVEGDVFIDYQKDSRLLVMRGTYDGAFGFRDGESGQFWLEFKNNRLHLLKKIPM